MSAPPFALLYTPTAQRVIEDLGTSNATIVKSKKVRKALKFLQELGPAYPSLNCHKYSSLTGPSGEDVWEIYVENHTPTAWRIWWVYGPDADNITIVAVGHTQTE